MSFLLTINIFLIRWPYVRFLNQLAKVLYSITPCHMTKHCTEYTVWHQLFLGVSSEEVKARNLSQGALWHETATTLMSVGFGDIKTGIMWVALEAVTLRASCLEWNIYDSEMTNLLLVFSSANLRCQISLLNFKGWYAQRSGAEVSQAILEPFRAHVCAILIDGLVVEKVILYHA